jgi:hypothetical protein
LVAADSEIYLSAFGKAAKGGDDTAVFQRAILAASATKQLLRIPASRRPYRIGPINIPGNTHILIEAGGIVEALPNYKQFQRMINIVDASGVVITGYGAILRMDKAVYKSGEYRHCVYISGSTDVAIKGVSCVNAAGDGFYVSGSERKAYSESVRLEGVTATGSRRQGLSVISAKDLSVYRSHFNLSRGQRPECGIDLEPEHPTDRLEKIRIEDSTTSSNSGDGIRIDIGKLKHRSVPVSIVLSHHKDFSAGSNGLMCRNESNGVDDVRGSIFVDRFESTKAQKYGVLFSFWNSTGPTAVLENVSIIDANESHSTDDNAAVSVMRGGGGKGAIGNVEFVRTSIKDTRSQPKLDYYFNFIDYSWVGINKVSFHHAVSLTGAIHKTPLGLFQGQGVDSLELGNNERLSKLWERADRSRQSITKR